MIHDTPRPMLVTHVPPAFFPPVRQQYAFQPTPYTSYPDGQYASPVECHRPPTPHAPSSSRTQSQPPPDRTHGTIPDPYFSLPSSPASSPFSKSPDTCSPESLPESQLPTPTAQPLSQLPTPAQTPSYPIPAAPSYPSSPSCSYRSPFSSPFCKTPASLKRSTTLPQKKPTRSTLEKRTAVQLSLEVKVEKAKGFIVIPLGRALPPAPPSSPVLGPTPLQRGTSWGDVHSAPLGVATKASADYFAGWDGKLDEQEEWVEHPNNGMEVDLR